MASPQMQDPNDPLKDLRTGQTERVVDGGRKFGGWWLWLLIAAVILGVLWWAWWGWTGRGHQATAVQPGSAAQQSALAPSSQPGAVANTPGLSGSGVAILDALNKQTYIGKLFQVQNVPVQEEAGNRAFWIGRNTTTPMLVVLRGSGMPPSETIALGSRVEVNGTVEKAPEEATAKQHWSLSTEGARRLEQEGVYIEASQLQSAQQ